MLNKYNLLILIIFYMTSCSGNIQSNSFENSRGQDIPSENTLPTFSFQYEDLKYFDVKENPVNLKFKIDKRYLAFFSGVKRINNIKLFPYSRIYRSTDSLFFFHVKDSILGESIFVSKMKNNKYVFISNVYGNSNQLNHESYYSYIDKLDSNKLIVMFKDGAKKKIGDSTIFSIIINLSPRSFFDTIQLIRVKDLNL